MKVTLRSAWLLLCLSAIPLLVCGQTPQTPATPTVPETPPATATPSTTTPAPTPTPGTLAPPRFKLNPTNNGMELSIEPIYWLTRGKILLRTGDDNTTGAPSDLDYPGKLDHALAATAIVPINNNSSVRFTYFQTTLTGGSFAPNSLTLFGTAVGGGVRSHRQSGSEASRNYKLSYDYVTYYWNHKGGDVRFKTLYEIQYTSINTSVDDFQLLTNGTFNVNPVNGSTSIILPTFGVGLDGTLSRHFRWEARGSPVSDCRHRAEIADGEADVGVRFGRVELIAGARAYYFPYQPPPARSLIRGATFLVRTSGCVFTGKRTRFLAATRRFHVSRFTDAIAALRAA